MGKCGQHRVVRGELDPSEFARSVTGRSTCCERTATLGKINRSFRTEIRTGGSTSSLVTSLALGLEQTRENACGKDGSGTRHLEALFSMARMLGLILVCA